MGIDIRDGAQLECINCALCIDACDEIMTKIGRPKRLIGYDTDKNIERRSRGEKPAIQLARPRTLFYAAILAALGAGMSYALASRATLEVNIIRDRTPPYVVLSDGSIRNAYTVRIVNKSNSPRDLMVALDSAAPLDIVGVGEKFENGRAKIRAAGDEVRSVRLLATVPAHTGASATFPVTVRLTDEKTGEEASSPTTFLTEER
jgi:polyferredoxin